jgi:hypothetical protein
MSQSLAGRPTPVVEDISDRGAFVLHRDRFVLANADQPRSPFHLLSPYHEPIILQMCDTGSREVVFVLKDIAAEPLAKARFALT